MIRLTTLKLLTLVLLILLTSAAPLLAGSDPGVEHAMPIGAGGPVMMAALRPGAHLIWQRTSPTIEKPDGPVLYQIIFRSSATPGNVPLISPQFTLMNSHIMDNGSTLTFSEIVSFAGGQTFPGTITGVSAGTGLTGGGSSGTVAVGIANMGVTTVQIGSGAAAIGQALVADGAGGASWQSLPAISFSWGLAGNAGTGCTTTPCAEFLGTTDGGNLEFRVMNKRALRIEPATDTVFGLGFSPNMIGGFSGNVVTGAGVAGATIAGGGAASVVNTVSGSYATVGGGLQNTASGFDSTVGGGATNTASGGFGSTVAGGYINTASGESSIVGGGRNNTASGIRSTVAGGQDNKASGNFGSVAGGGTNTASGIVSTVAGGYLNTASGDYSFAAGRQANTNSHPGAFAWGDSTAAYVNVTADNQFVARAVGGFNFWTGVDGGGNVTVGATLLPGMTAWSALSDRNAKEHFASVDGREILARLAAIPISTWNYKSADAPYRHIGPMAQDFYAAFQVGEDDKHITTIDADGVALAAIQGLNQKLEEEIRQKDSQIAAQQKQLESQQSQMAAMQQQMKAVMLRLTAMEKSGQPGTQVASAR